MTQSDARLAQIVTALIDAGADVLVMGGHAVRYYGLIRITDDYDLITELATPDQIREKVTAIAMLHGARFESAWRGNDFARFVIGSLPTGKDERLEFWIRNPLLPDFLTLKARSETGMYGGRLLPFLSINDLIISKQTERDSDWDDVDVLEELADGRQVRLLKDGKGDAVALFRTIRSRRGMDDSIQLGCVADAAAVTAAIIVCDNPITFTFLYPFVPENSRPPFPSGFEPAVAKILETVRGGDERHFGLIEVSRRLFRRKSVAADKADKQRVLNS